MNPYHRTLGLCRQPPAATVRYPLTLVWLDGAARAEADGNSSDELTLADAYVFPSISTAGTQSGGHWLPVMRVPISSIASWWIVEGRNIPGKSGFSGGLGLGFAVGV